MSAHTDFHLWRLVAEAVYSNLPRDTCECVTWIAYTTVQAS